MTAARFERVLIGAFFPVYDGEEPAEYWKKIEAHAEGLHRIGATHVQVNYAPLSVFEVMEPENSYMRFTTYGHTPDKYVTSALCDGVYHPSFLELNRKHLLVQAGFARRFGFRCFVCCVEPCLMPEYFFAKHPHLRGPRVDNPAASSEPRFAMCVALPEVQDHYRQLMRNLVRLCPEIDEIHIFTNDSGAGFCYSERLYSGPNGPVHCRGTPAAKHAQLYCAALLAGGREANPEFRVVMTSGLSPREKEEILDGAPAGVASSIYGAFAWGGGLEDRWQNHAVGPVIHKDTRLRAEARAWAEADRRARAEAVTSRGGLAYASYNPDYYSGPSDAPCPFQTHEVMMTYLRLGVKNVIGGAWITPWHANSAIFKRAVDRGAEDTAAAVRALAVEWAGERRADRLCEAWSLSELADREWPNMSSGGYASWCQPMLVEGPILPDSDRLSLGLSTII